MNRKSWCNKQSQRVLILLGTLCLVQCSQMNSSGAVNHSPSTATHVNAPSKPEATPPVYFVDKSKKNKVAKSNNKALTKKAKSELNPKAAEINIQLGMSYLKNGDMQRAQMKLQQALKQAPNDPIGLNAMAYFYSHTGQVDTADSFYQQTLAKYPRSGLANNNYGVFLCQHQRAAEAIPYFVRATRDTRYLKAAEAFENAGLCSLKAGNTAKAWEFFHYAHQRDPQRASVLMELSKMALQHGKVEQAQKYLNGYERIVGSNAISDQMSQKISATHQSPVAG